MAELAILGGPKTRTELYPQWPVWDQRDIDAVTEVTRLDPADPAVLELHG